MARPTYEERLEIAHRREKVSRMLVADVPRAIIAETLGISLETIYNDVKMLRRMWRRRGLSNVALLVADHALRYHEIVKAEWAQYALDKNPRHAEVIAKVLNQEAELYGLKAPLKLAPTTPDGSQPYNPLLPSASISNEELLAAVKDMVAQLEATVGTVDGEAVEVTDSVQEGEEVNG